MKWIHCNKIALGIVCASILSFMIAQADEDILLSHSKTLISWLVSNSGYMHPSLKMRRLDESDPTSMFGVFTESELKEGTLLFSIPDDIILHSTDNELQQLDCGLVRVLVEELKKKDESEFAPYINYLLDTQPPGQLPSGWSDAGKEMLMKALGDENFNISDARIRYDHDQTFKLKNTLPPSNAISWLEIGWYKECDGERDDLSQYAALLVLQRSWDDILIPIYDMVSHRNGIWFNTKSDDRGVHKGNFVYVYANRDIFAEEQIYGSYNMCEDCSGRVTTYGTAEIFRDYGFVEDMPQTWIFPDIEIGFRMDELEEEDDEGNPQYMIVEWIDEDEPDADDVNMLQIKLDYIEQRIKMLEDRSAWSNVPDHEWEQTVHYLMAMKKSIEVALEWYDDNVLDPDTCVADGTCTISLARYTNLDLEYNTKLETGYPAESCDIDAQFIKFDDGTFTNIEEIQSQYQTISFLQDLSNRDTCMDLDGTMQICGSYRPHYHEYMVHQTARFLPKNSVKRILFVGGGDSMLLHEALKYPYIELVVGLELDQKVTRGCFKHFGTQPHFDDDRVEWWFGDASKSLLMLPKDYFGSFDLVLVDLSETVMSFSVSKELTVLEALTLLVKPDGIFVKNEVYFEQFKNMFPYTAQVTWRDNPVICAQVMVMGSRTVDFMNPISGPTLIDHGIKNLVVRELNDIEDNFELYHDYAVNVTSFHLCNLMADKDTDSIQIRSPGILLVAEVEGSTGDLTGNGLLASLLLSLRKEDMTIALSEFTQHGNHTFVFVSMKEGYVIARAIPDYNYVGLDIHIWSSMHKQNHVLNSIVAAVGGGSKPLSSYRVITGGMFGVDSWREDEKLHGPQFKELCNVIKGTEPEVTKHNNSTKKSDVFLAIEQGLRLLQRNQLNVAILVGNIEGSENSSYDHVSAISKLENVTNLEVLSCASMAHFNRFDESANEALTACEKHLYDIMIGSSDIELFDAIIIDSSADKITSSIFLKLMSTGSITEIMNVDSIVITSSVTKDEKAWRKNLMLRLKDEVFDLDPNAAFVDIAIENKKTDSEFNVMITNYGLEGFVFLLNETIVEFNALTKNDLFARVNILNGGAWRYQKDFKPSRVFLPDDYDQSEPLEQWTSQIPIGHQAILQLEPQGTPEEKVVPISEDILSEAVNRAVKEFESVGWDANSVQKSCDVGEGCLFLALFDSGTLSVLWDGRSHIDINIFSMKEDIDLVDLFVKSFMHSIPTHAIMLRDEQPRGLGRVVSYFRDLSENGELPHWAPPIHN